MRHIHTRPFLRLLFSLCSLPSPLFLLLFLSFSVHPSSSFSPCLRGVPTEAPPRGCVVTAESSNVDRIPNWVGGVSAKGRLAQVEVRGKYRSLHAGIPLFAGTLFPCLLRDNSATLPFVNGDEGGPFAREGHPVSSGDRPRKKSLMAIPISDPRNSFDVEKSGIAYFKNSRKISQMTSRSLLS